MKLKNIGQSLIIFVAMILSTHAYAEIIWIDVRSAIEHSVDSIEGDVRIPYGDIVEEVKKMYPEKSTEIQLYCRSGGRAEKAMAALLQEGYTDVKNAGGINDARKTRGIDI